jgi:hypothetical protein
MDNTRKYVKLEDEEKEEEIYKNITNIFEIRKNIPECLKNIYKKCSISLKLSDEYDISVVEKNLNKLNKIYEDLLKSKEISVSPLYSQFHGLFTKGKWLKVSNELKDEKIEYKIESSDKLKKYIYHIENILEYLNKNNKELLKKILENIKNIKDEKCIKYCENKDDNCNENCKKNINRFQLLVSIIIVYQLLNEKIKYEELKKSLQDEIYELETLLNEKDKLKNQDFKVNMFNKYKDSIDYINKNKKESEKIILTKLNYTIFENILENKKKYLQYIMSMGSNYYYNNCIITIDKEKDCIGNV